ncbi:uncharacterized protein LOC111454377 [Cucurbita moschata]|uniref:Uncharacterized protein LOC111454377 n=1 Tax=Cucurbita moschata TaxID=3662 RepID=A0A6J1GI70_CUCMO|nr:uncharacterized protein LOC111454377 [Cucurbita moschata]
MRGNTNGGGGGSSISSPEKRAACNHGNHHKSRGSESEREKEGSSSGGGEGGVWLPEFVIALTNKEKEEDFMAIKGCKPPLRPKKRPKIIQRTINLVSPGTWLCDLTLDRYEVREKKMSKKRRRGLKAIVKMESDSEWERHSL